MSGKLCPKVPPRLSEQQTSHKVCPNAREQRKTHSCIDQPTFLVLVNQQLSSSIDTDRMTLGIHGSRGAHFRVMLSSRGYTVASLICFASCLWHEAACLLILCIHVRAHLSNTDPVFGYRRARAHNVLASSRYKDIGSRPKPERQIYSFTARVRLAV
jgi:hypothetical protein